ncbi:hypothetical protein POM88_014761 [Heracleum sosnowskyi]|uniref:Protein FAR1-RELATED SEQUENCE n=1 Tax=Heracleum sosnowskyi TaxID=360622 RepID=A0AAD8MWT8_9APIA|nr:hypothetical protein POM88_014761 [Heracleum sosnowskyi]
MHEQRHHWVRAYLGKTFFAGMKSSQRSESMNDYFDGFVHCTTPLSEFVDQYDAAIDDRRGKEENDDFTCMTTKPDFGEMYPIEAHAGKVYTRSVLKKFMQEFKLLFHCRQKKVKSDGDNVTYEVTFEFKVGTLLNNQSESSGKEVGVLEALKFRTFINHVYERVVHDQNLITIATDGLRDIVNKIDVFVSEQMNSKEETSGQIASSAHETSQFVNMSRISVRDLNKWKMKGRPKLAGRK